MAAHGLEMVLKEIRMLRDELKEQRAMLDDLRDDVNTILNKDNEKDK